MMTRRVLIGNAAGLLLANELVAAQAGASGPRVVFEHDVPDLTMKGWSATGVEVSYGPGQSSPPHRHPGITIAYVLEGEIRSRWATNLRRRTRSARCSSKRRISFTPSHGTRAIRSRQSCWR